MPSETTMDLNETQVANASKALITHLKKQDDDDLLAEDRKIYLALTLSVMPKKALKAPRRLEIPHSMFAYDSAEICFICKDGDIDYEELVASSGMKNVTVISMSTLAKEHKAYEALRILVNKFDFFVADRRIVPMLPRTLGKRFTEKKKFPIAIRVAGRNIKTSIENAVNAAYFNYTKGTSCSIRIGHSGMTWKQIGENVMRAWPQIMQTTPKQGKDVQSAFLRADNSVSLPIYQGETIRLSEHEVASMITAKRGRKQATAVEEDEPVTEKTSKKSKGKAKSKGKTPSAEPATKKAKAATAAETPKSDEPATETKAESPAAAKPKAAKASSAKPAAKAAKSPAPAKSKAAVKTPAATKPAEKPAAKAAKSPAPTKSKAAAKKTPKKTPKKAKST